MKVDALPRKLEVDMPPPHSNIVEAARQLSQLKFELDCKARSSPKNIPDDLHGPCTGGEYGPHFGRTFLSSILPFLPNTFSSTTPVIMNVPTTQVLGCSWRIWPDPNISQDEKDEVVAYINSDSGIVDTLYTYIPQLALFMAEEGKNRVNFCRYHSIPEIPARVLTMDYPSPGRIKIYTLSLAGGNDVWALLDGRYLQKVSHYAFVLPLMRAYGVTISDSWPDDLPPPSELVLHSPVETFRDYNKNSQIIDTKHVIEVLRKRNEYQRFESELKRCGIWQLGVSIKDALAISTTLITLSFSVFWALGDSIELIKIVSIATMAFSCGVLFVLAAPIVKTPRKYLRQKYKHPIRDGSTNSIVSARDKESVRKKSS
ncbi:hypothetical protein L1D14_23075 [Vibrio tubiashii]|uniref:hypothetical protein n=1 Tax=Vibrio tubiashii TaxID=29498 RepID=UPI001EFEA1B6|nr:hypothetical protein [Vibrio tubiashii]MCG9579088.1 hypothetical protein [Vibrio tubiashii]